MATEQTVNINFQQGLNTKVDPWQLPAGQFLSLENSIFQTGGLLAKRNGYGVLPGDAPEMAYLATLNGNLIGIGNTVNAYSPSAQAWVTKGSLQPCSLSVLPLIRNNFNQIQNDTAVSNNLVCIVYTQQVNLSGVNYYYAIEDATTGQNIVAPTAIPALAGGAINGSSRVFVVGSFFVIVSDVLISGHNFLQYVSIPVTNPFSISSPQNTFPEMYVPSTSNPNWDAIVSGTTLVLAYNTTVAGQGIHVTSLNEEQIALNSDSGIVHVFTGANYHADLMSLCVDASTSPNIIYINFWNSNNSNVYTAAVTIGVGTITTVFNPVAVYNPPATKNLASAAVNGKCWVFFELSNTYSYDSSIHSNLIQTAIVNQDGTIFNIHEVIRSVGLASKAFVINGVVYFLSVYQSTFQPTYFLINGSISTSAIPVIVAKLAYQNGGGYLTLGLPSVTVQGTVASTSYLFKQNIEALSTQNDTSQTITPAVYSQLGLNLVNFEIDTTNINSVEIGMDLHLSGGFLGMFDAFYPVEHNFFLFPDNIEASWSTTGGSIAAQPDGSTNTNAYAYMVTYEWTDMQGNPFRSAPSIPIFVTTTGSGSTGSITINGPTLRLTSKINTPVKIVIYRWSVETQAYNQVTSIFAPLQNSTTGDSFSFTDTLADSSVIGNNLIYTTGGVVPDTNAPASNILTIFDTRLWLVSAEDPNLLWVSKTVVEGVPVEMSSLFTIFVAPNIGTVGSSGDITAIAPMDDKLIIFKENAIFYINGTGPDNLGTTSPGCPLGNYSPPTFITAVTGCRNQQSIVLTQEGLMFQSDKGIWLLRRDLATVYIGAPVEAFNASLVTSSVVVPDSNYVLFTLDTGEMLMYDYYYQQWGTFTGVPTQSSCIYNQAHTVLNQFGDVWQETPGKFQDGLNPVLMSFTTSWFNLASLQGYERFYEFLILAKYLSPHYLNVQIAYDYNSSIYHAEIIKPPNFSPSIPGNFGIQTPFGSPRNLEQWRIHAKQQLCQSFQITITEVFDSTLGTSPGAGFTMSGLNCKVGVKKARRPISGTQSVG
jgi:hypothetical protein